MPKQVIIDFLRNLAGNSFININQKVYQSEKSHSCRNRALINLMKSYGNIRNDLEVVLDLYFFICSVEMTCRELSQAASFLANSGINPLDGQRVVSPSKSKRINTIMQLCGFYDEAGEFSFKVGLPGKSGVGGGIVAVHPGKFSIAAWSPRLNSKGNSCLAMRALELFTTKTKMSIF
jgi:glutaminase